MRLAALRALSRLATLDPSAVVEMNALRASPDASVRRVADSTAVANANGSSLTQFRVLPPPE